MVGINSAHGNAQEWGLAALPGREADFIASVDQALGFDFAFLFNNEKETDAVMDGFVGRKLPDKLPEEGLVGLSWRDDGFRHLTNNKRPIAKMEDIQGLKLRAGALQEAPSRRSSPSIERPARDNKMT